MKNKITVKVTKDDNLIGIVFYDKNNEQMNIREVMPDPMNLIELIKSAYIQGLDVDNTRAIPYTKLEELLYENREYLHRYKIQTGFQAAKLLKLIEEGPTND